MDLREKKSSWHSSSSSSSAGQQQSNTLSNSNPNPSLTNNVDPKLIDDLHEFLPLLQSFLDQDRKVSSSFTRRGTMVYTKTPAPRESATKRLCEQKGRNTAPSIPTKSRRDPGSKVQRKSPGKVQDGDADSRSVSSTRTLSAELQAEELIALREQMEDLQRKLLEKEELLKSAEISMGQMSSIQSELDELKHQTSEKDSLLKSTQRQFSDTKIKLADKQAALEKIQWEAMTSNKKVEKLQEDLDSMQGEISSFMLIFEGLTNDENTIYAEDYDITPYQMDYVPEIDDMDEVEMQKMEEAREAYIAALAAAKAKQDEESMAAAASARLHLQSFVLRTETVN